MKSPAFQFYVRDWLCSHSVQRMTGDQVKAYLYLLCSAWLEDEKATLPNDNTELAMMARLDLDTWNKLKLPILERFRSNGNGRLVNERLMEYAVFVDKQKRNSASGRSLAQAKRKPVVEDEVEDEVFGSSPDNGVVAPTLPELQALAAGIGLSAVEVEKCYHHYQSQGWLKGNGQRVTDLRSILAKWKSSFLERRKNDDDKQAIQPRTIRDLNEVIAAKQQRVNDLRWERTPEADKQVACLRSEIKTLVARKAAIAA